MTTFVTRETIFFGGEIKCVLRRGGGGVGGGPYFSMEA